MIKAWVARTEFANMYENKRLGFLFVLPFVLGVLLFKLFPFVIGLRSASCSTI